MLPLLPNHRRRHSILVLITINELNTNHLTITIIVNQRRRHQQPPLLERLLYTNRTSVNSSRTKIANGILIINGENLPPPTIMVLTAAATIETTTDSHLYETMTGLFVCILSFPYVCYFSVFLCMFYLIFV